MTNTTLSSKAFQQQSGMRPVNLRTDLAPLADLIELVFDDEMDSNGRAAIREMRALSRMGAGLGLIAKVNELAVGIRLGYVWIQDGRLVGNVSVYPARWDREIASAWMIANVAVHPDYRQRGIAKILMQASMDMIRKKNGDVALLQVNPDNSPALNLYKQLGFVHERNFTGWVRGRSMYLPENFDTHKVAITHPRYGEWKQQYELAKLARPAELGGIGWEKPTHPKTFQSSIWKRITDALTFRNIEKLIVRSADEREILASMWIERSIAGLNTRLTIMTHPEHEIPCFEALLATGIRRFNNSGLMIEHPADDDLANDLLPKYRFRTERTLAHMRWNVRS